MQRTLIHSKNQNEEIIPKAHVSFFFLRFLRAWFTIHFLSDVGLTVQLVIIAFAISGLSLKYHSGN